MFHRWLKSDFYYRSDFINQPNGNVSRAQSRIKAFLRGFQDKIARPGNNLKTPKFHQMLHVVDYIMRHGPPSCYDGGPCEHMGKIKVKDMAKITNNQRDSLNFDISRRLAEQDVVDHLSNVFYQNHKVWPSEFCNDGDLRDLNSPYSDDDEKIHNYGKRAGVDQENNQSVIPNKHRFLFLQLTILVKELSIIIL